MEYIFSVRSIVSEKIEFEITSICAASAAILSEFALNFALNFLQNGASNEKILFSILDSFFFTQSPPVTLNLAGIFYTSII